MDDDEKILMCKKHQVLQRRINTGFSRRINIRARMCQQVKELNQTADSESFKLLSAQESLSQVYVFDDLQCDELCHVHRVRRG